MIPQISSLEDAIHTNIGQYFWWGVYEPQCTMQNKILSTCIVSAAWIPKAAWKKAWSNRNAVHSGMNCSRAATLQAYRLAPIPLLPGAAASSGSLQKAS